MDKMKKRQRNKKAAAVDILKSNDPITIAKHLFEVLNQYGYSTRSFDSLPDLQTVDMLIHDNVDGKMRIKNIAQDWEIIED